MIEEPESVTKKVNFVMAALFVLAASSLQAASSATPPIQRIVKQINPDVKLIQFTNGVQVEQLTGAAALSHLQNLIARHPDAFAASKAEMLRRGFAPTTTVFVERTYRQVRNPSQGGASSYQLVQSSSEQNSDGEIDFWSYAGADDSWQGTIYMEMYSDGAYSTWDGQIDTTNQDYPYNWVTQTGGYEGNDGPDNRTALPKRPPLPGNIRRAAEIQFASWKPGQSVLPVTFSWYNWSICWRAGVISGCGTAAVGCIRSAAAWPACFATWCIGAEVATGVGCAIAQQH